MIKYALACEQAHEFESWFPTGDAFEAQSARGLVTCPVCDSPKVEKRIMAPAVSRMAASAPSPPPASQPVVAFTEQDKALRAMIRSMREHVRLNAEDVGRSFAEEARKMHYGEADQRAIYGEANGEEARSLIEEGIEVLPLPVLPDDRN